MDYSAANHELWNVMIQLGLISGVVLVAGFLRSRVKFVQKSMMPIAVLGGFLLLGLKYTGLVPIDTGLMEMLVYHAIGLGFIAMSLRVNHDKSGKADHTGFKSGAIIVSTYLVQGAAGLIVTILLAWTFMPNLFKAAGLLLPLGYGQGPGQANNIGSTYESLGFTGGHSFGLAIAATGYLVACIVGVIILNVLAKKGRVVPGTARVKEQQPGVDFFQDDNELPVSDSIDKLSVQISMVLLVYLVTFLASWGLTSLFSAISEGVAKTVNSLIWGFNFVIGSALAMLLRTILEAGKKKGAFKRQYQNNYLLNRISGFFFDVMIVAGIAAINFEDLSGLWVPFLLLAVVGGIVTWFHLSYVCKAVYKDYYYEGLISMYGMMTGTISSGVLLLREIDPNFRTPAANNLVTGSTFAIVLGAPVLVLVGLAPKSDILCYVTLGLATLYLAVLIFIIRFKRKGKKEKA